MGIRYGDDPVRVGGKIYYPPVSVESNTLPILADGTVRRTAQICIVNSAGGRTVLEMDEAGLREWILGLREMADNLGRAVN